MSAASVRAPDGAWRTVVRGLQLSPEFRDGLGVTMALAVLATAGRVIVPITVQQIIDRGIGAEIVDVGFVYVATAAAAVVVVGTALAGYAMNARLASATETALSNLRVRAFRHIHDLSTLHHATEHRGSLTARVTADVDTISRFMQWGGVLLVVNLGQLVVATIVMALYSWQLTLVVLVTFAPLGIVLHWFQARLSRAYDLVRERVGALLGALSESVVAAPVVRAYGIEDRTDRRVTGAVDRHFHAAYGAGRTAALMFSSGEIFAAIATAGAVIVGVQIGLGGGLTEGRLIAFLFLVTLFVGPAQVATEVLNEAQTAVAGWRRVLGVLDTVPDVADPPNGIVIPPGPVTIRFEHVDFTYPARPVGVADDDLDTQDTASEAPPLALVDVDVELAAQSRIAIVGETGSGKTTFAKVLTRLMDPTSGRVLVNGVPLADVTFASLRQRIVMVPQDGFLFDATIADNVRHGRGGATDDDVALAFTELGLGPWLEGLPAGLATRVGERGDALSVGERQLVALARAYVANPDLLLLDEATSSVDPATEVRIQRALESLTRGRTAVAIAHRLSTAEQADEILVFDGGRLVQRGPHALLLAQPGPYRGLHASWSRRSA